MTRGVCSEVSTVAPSAHCAAPPHANTTPPNVRSPPSHYYSRSSSSFSCRFLFLFFFFSFPRSSARDVSRWSSTRVVAGEGAAREHVVAGPQGLQIVIIYKPWPDPLSSSSPRSLRC